MAEPVDDFDNGFEAALAALNAEDNGEPAPIEETPAEETPAEETPAEETSAEETPAEETPAEETPAEPAPIEESPAEAVPAETAPEPAPEPVVIPDPYDLLTDEDKAALAEYEADYPEIFKAEALRRQVDITRALNAFAGELGKILQPVLATSQQYASVSHEQAIASAHPDYREVTPGLLAWVEKQPGFVKAAYNDVLQNGGTRDVIDLLSAYKQTVGAAQTPASAPAPAAAPASQQAAAAALAPVGSRRGQVPTGEVDPNDYDAAFAEAAKVV